MFTSIVSAFNHANRWNTLVFSSHTTCPGHSTLHWPARKPNNILAWFTRSFTSQSPDQIRHQIFRTIVLPKLEDYASVWGPHHLKGTDVIENMQKFAARVITHEWKSDYPSLYSKLNWQTLNIPRKIQKLKVYYNYIFNLSIIPAATFTPHLTTPIPQTPSLKNPFITYTSTYTHKFSFYVNVIPLWNSLL